MYFTSWATIAYIKCKSFYL
uniref:Uncharacterized protein n=1 Tax=Anguilla anguilla TaxID=7936 RepID=A0A0E9PQK6_ANGAN